ncbi:chromosome partitioning protein ParB [Coraliomargarita sinensis]|uniref:Chromosome partitioning protein ParB n=1 Tax=Coraliomargarita sinensis TaxID=2174842 RepID=A0A317ZD12_9BACT|nr:ParB N-terminal domain-containing protein [Coraliomargarita sinensis]PXA03026.1 chromosome partitioning protein ParB [Coraliomargarita sinensis]
MQNQDLALEKIDIYGGTQARVATNDEAISSYAEAMLEGAQFPPVVTYYDGSNFWLADGFHRFLAAQRNEFETIAAVVYEGSRTDALRHALGANATNGIYRSNADKRNACEVALEEWPNMSNAVIAEMCKVSPDLVRRCRLEMEKLNRIESPREVTGKDGKQYPAGIERQPRGGSQKVENDGSSSGAGQGSSSGSGGKAKGDSRAPGGASMEIEADARKMIRDGEIKHAELDKLQSATAIDYAETALNILNRMKPDDPRRTEAVGRIERWLAKEKAGAELA